MKATCVVYLLNSLVLLANSAANAAPFDGFQESFAHKLERMEFVHVEMVVTDFGSLDSSRAVSVHNFDYDFANNNGRHLYTFLSAPSVSLAVLQYDGVRTEMMPARSFFRSAVFTAGNDRLLENMERKHGGERWRELDELTQWTFLPIIAKAIAIPNSSRDNTFLMKHTNAAAVIEVLCDWKRNVILSATTIRTNGIRIIYEYGDFRETDRGVFPQFMRYSMPGTGVHTRELCVNKIDFPSRWNTNIFAFVIPEGTSVADTRFDPPVVYRQGRHYYTDEELVALAADIKSGKTVIIGQAAERSSAVETSARKRFAWSLGLVALALLVPVSIGCFWRKRPRNGELVCLCVSLGVFGNGTASAAPSVKDLIGALAANHCEIASFSAELFVTLGAGKPVPGVIVKGVVQDDWFCVAYTNQFKTLTVSASAEGRQWGVSDNLLVTYGAQGRCLVDKHVEQLLECLSFEPLITCLKSGANFEVSEDANFVQVQGSPPNDDAFRRVNRFVAVFDKRPPSLPRQIKLEFKSSKPDKVVTIEYDAFHTIRNKWFPGIIRRESSLDASSINVSITNLFAIERRQSAAFAVPVSGSEHWLSGSRIEYTTRLDINPCGATGATVSNSGVNKLNCTTTTNGLNWAEIELPKVFLPEFEDVAEVAPKGQP